LKNYNVGQFGEIVIVGRDIELSMASVTDGKKKLFSSDKNTMFYSK
jgi:hypothetical protein